MSQALMPAGADERTRNPHRPRRLADIIGQDDTKDLFRRAIDRAWERKRPMDHVLLIGPSGIGKTTFAHAVANDLGANVFLLGAPVDTKTLADLRTTMVDGDVLFIDEIHMQAVSDRRGKGAATEPEVLFGIMEDRVLTTGRGALPFPHITIIGGTTDEGMLPDAFINRFPLRPRLKPYTRQDLVRIAYLNAQVEDVDLDREAAVAIADASRGVPREVNNLIKNASVMADLVDDDVVSAVLRANGLTRDGLTADMQGMLRFLYEKAGRTRGDGEVVHQASVNTIATAIGKSRDSKAIALRVEPYLIERGYVQVTHGGRLLTDRGIERARALTQEDQ